MFLEMLLQEEKKVFHREDPPEEETLQKSCLDESEGNIEEGPDDGLTEEEHKELEKEKYLVDCGCPGIKIYRFPTPPPEPDPSSLSSSSKGPDIFLPFKSIIDRQFIEAFPDGLFGEVYGCARRCLPYEIHRYYNVVQCVFLYVS